MKNKDVILKKLFALQRFGIKPGLERTIKLSEIIGNPHTKFPSIHIAGTNGKGSVCSLLSSIFIEAGYKVGLYTSPHIKDFNERIRINGEKISDEKLVSLVDELLPYQEKFNNTFFEITTVSAFKYFADENIDIAIIETGMGGGFDSTNIINPILSIITKIDVDHSQYLGNTIEKIAFEKAGIMKQNSNTIISQENHKLKKVFEQYSKINKLNFEFSKSQHINNVSFNEDLTMTCDIEFKNKIFKNIQINLSGRHQIENLNLTFCSLEYLSNFFDISDKSILNGLKNIKSNSGYFGRITDLNQIFKTNFPIIIDVAHNPDAIKNSLESLKLHFPNIKKWNIIFAMMKDKDILLSLELLMPYCDKLIITQPTIQRAASVKEIYHLASELNFVIETEPNIYKIPQMILNSNHPTLIVGSFYLIGDLIEATEKILKIKIEI